MLYLRFYTFRLALGRGMEQFIFQSKVKYIGINNIFKNVGIRALNDMSKRHQIFGID